MNHAPNHEPTKFVAENWPDGIAAVRQQPKHLTTTCPEMRLEQELKEMEMNSKGTRMLLLTVVIGLAAFFAGPHIWPPSPDVPMPPANFLPGYIALSAIEALAFGFAIAFAVFGWPAIRGLDLGAPWLNKLFFGHYLLVYGELVDAR